MAGFLKNIFQRGVSPRTEDSGRQPQRLSLPPEIPESIREAYEQSCYLVQRCPKASGVLSRYCLQQIARDFWQLSNAERGTLSAEFSLLTDRVLAETQASINYIRKFGTIESQLSNDRDLMVDTTVDEAKMLIALVQLLLQEWYVDRQQRRRRRDTIKMMVDEAKSKQAAEPVENCARDPGETRYSSPQHEPPPVNLKPAGAAPKDSVETALAAID